MSKEDIEILEDDGWIVECESPFEIRHTDGSFATNQAAYSVLNSLKDRCDVILGVVNLIIDAYTHGLISKNKFVTEIIKAVKVDEV
jgi:hypothetical protein